MRQESSTAHAQKPAIQHFDRTGAVGQRVQRAGRRTGTCAHRRRGGGQAHDSTGCGAQHRARGGAELRAVGGAQSERGRGR